MSTGIKKIIATKSRVVIPRHAVRVTLIIPPRTETTLEINSDHRHLKTLTVIINPGASLSLIQNFSADVPQELNEHIVVGSRATLTYVAIHKLRGVSNFRCLIEHQKAARSNVRLALAGKKQARNSTTVVSSLNAADSQSTVLVLAAASDQAQLDISANIAIGQRAELAVADLSLHALLLSPQAVVELTPKMEIKNSTVVAAHRATVSRFDPLEKFYLHSRGLTTRKAEAVLTNNFFSRLVDTLSLEMAKKIIPALKIL
ncbi:MAG: hypothetical protein A2840_02800 [Candidatus Buchananbacteria bacterium RIFCSPHIGHO2_01_FULL_47_11b]|uniref:SUF system FeS cluster assembly SufBD core domain-containing protein n=1 Tax=Candidatus Buchananbacteria bacterium RIFCSPHIGHO2_01_FULL_47_11b TaxID=1797537 RepID=A0A1G1Y2R9_9BACT|nr:MAG: hypothetical protein A2840_02800 [Candidatus Buchananbacteria bacterium RIFCSPHIGHO2_01_FULL_47_11b]